MATRRRRGAPGFEAQEDAKAELRALLDEHAEHFKAPPRVMFFKQYVRGNNSAGGLHVFIAEPNGEIRSITNVLRIAAGIPVRERGQGYSPDRGILLGVTFQSPEADLRDLFMSALGTEAMRMGIQISEGW